MTRFVIDPSATLRLAEEGLDVAPGHELLAPTLWRSQVLSELHEAVHGGQLSEDAARAHLAYVAALKVRLLGDAVLRRVAWQIADELDWAATYRAEYIALANLQADALITLDRELADSAGGIVEVASIDALRAS